MFGFNDLSTPLKAIIALAFVLILVVIAGLLLRRIAGGRLKLPGQGGRARQPRLGVIDIFELDRQRQLVLLRRDNVEHLVMIGGPNDVVIEASIMRGQARASAQPQAPLQEAAEPPAIAAQPQMRVARQDVARVEAPVADRVETKPAVSSTTALAGAAAGAAAAAVAVTRRDSEPADIADSVLGGPLEAPTPPLQTPEPAVETRRLPEFLRQDVRYGEPAVATADKAELAPSRGSPVRDRQSDDPQVERLAAAVHDGSVAQPGIDIADQLAAELEALVAQPAPPATQPPALEPQPKEAAATTSNPVVEPPTQVEQHPAAIGEQPGPGDQEFFRADSTQADAAEQLARELERMLGANAQPILQPGALSPSSPASSPLATGAPEGAAPIDFKAELAKASDRPTVADKPRPASARIAPADSAVPTAVDSPQAPETAPAPAPPQPTTAPVADKPAADDPFSLDAIEAEFARLLNRPIKR